MEHQWIRKRGARFCQVCGIQPRSNKPEGNCPGADNLVEALTIALKPERTIELCLITTQTWQERLGGQAIRNPWPLTLLEHVDAIEMDAGGNFILWQDGCPRRTVGLDFVYSRIGGSISDETPITKMYDHTTMARIIDGQVWVQLPKKEAEE